MHITPTLLTGLAATALTHARPAVQQIPGALHYGFPTQTITVTAGAGTPPNTTAPANNKDDKLRFTTVPVSPANSKFSSGTGPTLHYGFPMQTTTITAGAPSLPAETENALLRLETVTVESLATTQPSVHYGFPLQTATATPTPLPPSPTTQPTTFGTATITPSLERRFGPPGAPCPPGDNGCMINKFHVPTAALGRPPGKDPFEKWNELNEEEKEEKEEELDGEWEEGDEEERRELEGEYEEVEKGEGEAKGEKELTEEEKEELDREWEEGGPEERRELEEGYERAEEGEGEEGQKEWSDLSEEEKEQEWEAYDEHVEELREKGDFGYQVFGVGKRSAAEAKAPKHKEVKKLRKHKTKKQKKLEALLMGLGLGIL